MRWPRLFVAAPRVDPRVLRDVLKGRLRQIPSALAPRAGILAVLSLSGLTFFFGLFSVTGILLWNPADASDVIRQLIVAELVLGAIPVTAAVVGVQIAAGNISLASLHHLRLGLLATAPLGLVLFSVGFDIVLLGVGADAVTSQLASFVAGVVCLTALLSAREFVTNLGTGGLLRQSLGEMTPEWWRRMAAALEKPGEDGVERDPIRTVNGLLTLALERADKTAFDMILERFTQRVEKLGFCYGARQFLEVWRTSAGLEEGIEDSLDYRGLLPRHEAALDGYLAFQWSGMIQKAAVTRSDWALRSLLNFRARCIPELWTKWEQWEIDEYEAAVGPPNHASTREPYFPEDYPDTFDEDYESQASDDDTEDLRDVTYKYFHEVPHAPIYMRSCPPGPPTGIRLVTDILERSLDHRLEAVAHEATRLLGRLFDRSMSDFAALKTMPSDPAGEGRYVGGRDFRDAYSEFVAIRRRLVKSCFANGLESLVPVIATHTGEQFGHIVDHVRDKRWAAALSDDFASLLFDVVSASAERGQCSLRLSPRNYDPSRQVDREVARCISQCAVDCLERVGDLADIDAAENCCRLADWLMPGFPAEASLLTRALEESAVLLASRAKQGDQNAANTSAYIRAHLRPPAPPGNRVRVVRERPPTPATAIGFPDIDAALAQFPETLKEVATYEQHVGYKCWKVPGRTRNWMQWIDGGTPLRIHFDNSQGEARNWKLFARFATSPRSPWEKPEGYQYRKAQWMPAGTDVWGCSYEALREYRERIQELQELLMEDLKRSYRYSIERYR